jgi:hypothetical protein
VHAQQDQQAAANARDGFAVDRDRGRRDPLDDRPQRPMRIVCVVRFAVPVASTSRTTSDAVVTRRLAT